MVQNCINSGAKLACFFLSLQFVIGTGLAQPTLHPRIAPGSTHGLQPVFCNPGKLADPKKTKIEVAVVLSEICMLSRFYAKEIQSLTSKWENAGVYFFGVFPNAFSTDSAICAFAQANQLTFPMYRDSMAIFTRKHKLTTTPEVCIFLDGKVGYSGRIDDFYVAIGRHKPFVHEHFMENALTKLIEGQTPSRIKIPPIGCLIDFRLWNLQEKLQE